MNFLLKGNFLFKCVCVLIICFIQSSIPSLAEEKSGYLVIKSADIEKMNVRSMPDLLNQISGVKANESSVSIQGSSKVKVLLDNRPLNDPSSGFMIKWNQVSISSVEKVEIRKGGGGVEYGEDSGGGVILITTKQSNIFQYDFEAYGGNLNTQSYSANCQANANIFTIGASLGYETTDGFRTNDDKESKRAGLMLNYNSGSLLSLQPGISYYSEKKGMAGYPGHETPHYRWNWDDYSVSLIAKFKGIRSKSNFNDATRENYNRDVPIYFDINVKKFEQEITSPISIGNWGTANAGVGLENAEADGSLPDKVSEEKYFMFVTHTIKPDQLPISVYLGLRGVYYTEFDNAVNPGVRVVYNKERWNIKAGFSMVDNTPTFMQRYNRTTVTRPNPDLDIEKAKNYTIAFFSQIVDGFSVSVSAYYSEIDNRFSYNLYEDNLGNIFGMYENVGEAILQGIDTTINWKPSSAFSLNISYSFMDAKDADSDKYLPGQPAHKAQASLFIAPVENFSVVITEDYVSKQYIRPDNGDPEPEYFLTNCRAEYKLNKFNAFSEIKNIFDEKYRLGHGYPGPPRTWIAGINYTY